MGQDWVSRTRKQIVNKLNNEIRENKGSSRPNRKVLVGASKVGFMLGARG